MDKSPHRSVNQVAIDTRGKNSRTPESCMLYKVGLCSLGQNCHFVHVEGQISNVDSCVLAAGFGKKSCFEWLYKGRCAYGAKCKYAHVENEPLDQSRVHHDVSSDSRSQSATVDPRGSYRGPEKLYAPDRSKSARVDPRGPYQNSFNQYHGQSASQFGKKGDWKTRICSKWQYTRNCPHGTSCTYAHGENELRGQGGAQYELLSNLGTESATSLPRRPYHGPVNVPTIDQVNSRSRTESATAPPHRPYNGRRNVSASDRVISNIGTQSATANPRGAYHGTANVPSRDHKNATHPFNWDRKTVGIYADWLDNEEEDKTI